MRQQQKQQKQTLNIRSLKMLVEKWSDLEIFQHVGARRLEPIISITRGNKNAVTLNFRAGFLSKAADCFNGNTHVIIGYSRRQNALIFDFTNDPKEQGALKLGFRPSNVTASITSALNFYNLDKEAVVGEYYPVLEPMAKNSEYWIIYLNDKVQ